MDETLVKRIADLFLTCSPVVEAQRGVRYDAGAGTNTETDDKRGDSGNPDTRGSV